MSVGYSGYKEKCPRRRAADRRAKPPGSATVRRAAWIVMRLAITLVTGTFNSAAMLRHDTPAARIQNASPRRNARIGRPITIVRPEYAGPTIPNQLISSEPSSC
jgi:hypothetical protein